MCHSSLCLLEGEEVKAWRRLLYGPITLWQPEDWPQRSLPLRQWKEIQEVLRSGPVTQNFTLQKSCRVHAVSLQNFSYHRGCRDLFSASSVLAVTKCRYTSFSKLPGVR